MFKSKQKKKHSESKRAEKLKTFEDELKNIFAANPKDTKAIDKKVNKIFEGYNRQYRKYFIFITDENGNIAGYKKDNDTVKYEERFDGVFIITSNRYDLTPAKKSF